MRTLVVDDDAPIRQLVRFGLERKGIDVEERGDVAGALAVLGAISVDVVILDLKLPDGSGLEVLSHLRQSKATTHVIILSRCATELDRIRGLGLGADDYVVKPFSIRELTARVLAVRRRLVGQTTDLLAFEGLEIDLAARTVHVDGDRIDLTAKEFALLAFLAARPRHVFSRADLLRAVWRSEPGWQSDATVTEHVRRLRKKICRNADLQRPVRTVAGSGYCFDAPTLRESGDQGEPAVVTFVGDRVVAADDVASSMLGAVDGAQLVGLSVSEIVAPRSMVAVRARQAVHAAGVGPRSEVMAFVDHRGGEVALEVSTSDTVWQGQPSRRIELRRPASESVRLRQLCTGVLSELTDAVIVTDMRFHVRSWNHAAERVYGWQEPEVLGRHILDAAPWVTNEDALEGARAQLEATGHWHGEGHQLTRDGSVIAVRVSTNVVRGDQGEPQGVISVTRHVDPAALEPIAEPRPEEISDLRRGIDAGELVVHYQPVVDLADRSVIAVEALVRWRHPTRGLLAPDSFIDIAERSGMIVDVGTAVFRQAIEQVAAWRTDGLDVFLSVNLSARELADPGLVDRMTAAAVRAGFGLDRLWLEVTETALIEDVDVATDLLSQLDALGVGVSIDDFGTGWASLTYLRRFPVHALKIDRSFVAGVDVDASSAAIVKSILSLGAELDLIVVAEGIETEAQAHVLQSLGCTIGQGYLFGRPQPAERVDFGAMQAPHR